MEDGDLENAIAALYGGPLEEFVQRRDLLVKELRAAGRRADASAVKALRKASRAAWALNEAALGAKPAFGGLEAAVVATVEAHAGGGNVRDAIAELRLAVREFAAQAARAAEQAGHPLEHALLANAVFAVLGSTEAFHALGSGHLTEIPEAGGLDFFTSLSAPGTAARPTVTEALRPAPVSAESGERDELEKAVREAGVELSLARARVVEAEHTLRELESGTVDAEERLRQADAEARALRTKRDRAREEVEYATEQLAAAERVAREAERRLEAL